VAWVNVYDIDRHCDMSTNAIEGLAARSSPEVSMTFLDQVTHLFITYLDFFHYDNVNVHLAHGDRDVVT